METVLYSHLLHDYHLTYTLQYCFLTLTNSSNGTEHKEMPTTFRHQHIIQNVLDYSLVLDIWVRRSTE